MMSKPATSKPATLHQGRPSNGFGKRIAMVVLGTLALAGLGGSPASALPITGVVSGGGRTVFTPPDPCTPTPQIVSFTASRPEITLGEAVTLSWNVQVPGGCNYSVFVAGQGFNVLQGAVSVQPLYTGTYSMTLTWGPLNALWVQATTGMITVDMPVDPADSTRKLVTLSTPSLPLFIQALKTPNTTVVISVDALDLSGLEEIQIADGVRLVGARTVVPGKPYSIGPLLFTTTHSPDHPRLFLIRGNNVRITGLRLQGPETEVTEGDDFTPIGISMNSDTWGPQAPLPIEIDHSELYGWSGSAVEVLDAGARINLNPNLVLVHDNFIHHNQHIGRDGYGVVVSKGAYATIERNVFDYNRHAIAGDGSNGSGYHAFRNLVLPNGGLNRKLWFLPIERDWYVHQFDMHGQSNCGAGSLIDDTLFNCGTAGHDVEIGYNSFLYTNAAAIKVRGTPQLYAQVYANVFAHDTIQDAVQYTETGVFIRADNQTGVKTWTAIDYCDFDGDGVPDRFLTTGQTWWFSSNRGQGPWVYLNTSTLTLDRGEVTLGYFDGDALCDVVAGGVTYSGGTTSPLRQVLRNSPARARQLLSQ